MPSALFFDIGVLLVVIGVSVGMIVRLGEELPPDEEEPQAMTMVLAICVAVTFAVSIYLMLGRELKGVAMGVFLLGHAANLSIIAMSGSPVHDRSPAAGGRRF